MAWTDEQLSMILSHVAGGGSLCCAENESARDAIARSSAQSIRIADWAYELMGCHLEMDADGGTSRGRHYLTNAEESCAYGGP
jgi:hypothetical protein